VNVCDTFINHDEFHPLHLWFVCTLPREGRVVILNLTSRDSCIDLACPIAFGEHSFVQHDSLIQYQNGSDPEIELVEQAFTLGLFTPDEPASPALIAKIRAGALRSEFTSRRVQEAIRRCPWTTPG